MEFVIAAVGFPRAGLFNLAGVQQPVENELLPETGRRMLEQQGCPCYIAEVVSAPSPSVPEASKVFPCDRVGKAWCVWGRRLGMVPGSGLGRAGWVWIGGMGGESSVLWGWAGPVSAVCRGHWKQTCHTD